jgi:hypothetical protein
MLSSRLCSVRQHNWRRENYYFAVDGTHRCCGARTCIALLGGSTHVGNSGRSFLYEQARAQVPPVSQHQPRHFGILQER